MLLPSQSGGPRRRRRSSSLRGVGSLNGGPRRTKRRGGGGGGRGGGGRLVPAVIGLLALAALAVAVVYGVDTVRDSGRQEREDAARRFAAAYAKGDRAAMWRALTPAARTTYSEARFTQLYDQAEGEAGVRKVATGRLGEEADDRVGLPVAASTRRFGTLRGTLRLPVSGKDKDAGVAWTPALRLPGLRDGERVQATIGPRPTPGLLRAADGSDLEGDALGQSIAGTAASGDKKATGLRRIHAATLNGSPSATLRFGDRVVKRVARKPGRSVTTTIKLGLQSKAQAALGDRLGGVAVIRPKDGAVQALAGLAVSAPQPPGSTFKIITTAAALQHGKATPTSSYPVRQFATLSGTKLRNASDESCGGGLSAAFAESCNSVFAPLGAAVGAKRLVATAEAFGFNEELTTVPAVKPSSIPAAKELRDDLAVGASAIGQDRDLATPLEMATVAATIGNGGTRVRPRLAVTDRRVTRRVVKPSVAAAVRGFMISVVQGGTGTAAAIPGIQVAGKTGTAELRPTAGGPPDPKNTDAWFVAFAPAQKPTVAVAVMLIGAGQGGASAAPIAKQVLQAALG